MPNAQEIIELEKRWIRYKIKEKGMLYAFLFMLISTLSFVVYYVYFDQQVKSSVKLVHQESADIKQHNTAVTPLINKMQATTILEKPIETNTTIALSEISKETNTTALIEKNILTPSSSSAKVSSKPYYFKLEPTERKNELFSSGGFLTLHPPFQEKSKEIVDEIQKNIPKKVTERERVTISIEMQEMDKIRYLENRYYSTLNILFALKLAQEHYQRKEYKNTLTWALRANDIDAQNSKSWYWFAKAKFKLNQKDDALKALRAYLSNNSSKRLSSLLHKIELGEIDDL